TATQPADIYTLSLHDALPISCHYLFPFPAQIAIKNTKTAGNTITNNKNPRILNRITKNNLTNSHVITAPRIKNTKTNNLPITLLDRKSTRLNSSHVKISYAVF